MMNSAGEEKLTHYSGHRTTAVLSAEELFRWRKKEVLPVPQRGGIKDFEPDGSWLQAKRLETFYEEHLSVLSEPRVEKSGNLVKGTWDSEKKLVNIEKTAKFWMKMGFAESDRNWLHPEEALFLMEVNCLEVLHHRVSLSLQEAFSLLLHPSGSITEEEYQVYAHLRRLGYIVLRHAGKLDITSYEMKIGLHNYSKKKHKKYSVKSRPEECESPATSKQTGCSSAATEHQQQQDKCCAGSDPGNEETLNCSKNEMIEKNEIGECSNITSKATNGSSASPASHGRLSSRTERELHSENNMDITECKRLCKGVQKESPESSEERNIDYTKCESISGGDSSECERYSKRKKSNAPESADLSLNATTNHKSTDNNMDGVSIDSTSEEPPKKKKKLDNHFGNSSMELDGPYNADAWSDATRQSFSGQSSVSQTEWDFSTIQFPDMGGKDIVSLSIPPPHCLPPNTCVDEEYEDICIFDVEEYRQQQQHLPPLRDPEDNHRHLRQLEFSYAEWYKKNFQPVSARNWKEWKEALGQREKSFLSDSPVAHLWQGEVTPLVQPQHSHSTDSILQRLSVILPYQGPFPAKERQERTKISFDVYLPNTTFRKSRPGLPDHRVCVAREIHPPDVFDVHAATSHLDDQVPLHWAVVNSGDICFFVFEDLELPVHPSSLG